jgi:hypothetical protein
MTVDMVGQTMGLMDKRHGLGVQERISDDRRRAAATAKPAERNDACAPKKEMPPHSTPPKE